MAAAVAIREPAPPRYLPIPPPGWDSASPEGQGIVTDWLDWLATTPYWESKIVRCEVVSKTSDGTVQLLIFVRDDLFVDAELLELFRACTPTIGRSILHVECDPRRVRDVVVPRGVDMPAPGAIVVHFMTSVYRNQHPVINMPQTVQQQQPVASSGPTLVREYTAPFAFSKAVRHGLPPEHCKPLEEIASVALGFHGEGAQPEQTELVKVVSEPTPHISIYELRIFGYKRPLHAFNMRRLGAMPLVNGSVSFSFATATVDGVHRGCLKIGCTISSKRNGTSVHGDERAVDTGLDSAGASNDSDDDNETSRHLVKRRPQNGHAPSGEPLVGRRVAAEAALVDTGSDAGFVASSLSLFQRIFS